MFAYAKRVTYKIYTFFVYFFIVCALAACASSGGTSSKPKTASEARAKADKQALIHTKLARGYMQQGQLSTAKDSLNTALRISPNHSDSNYVMALLMAQLKQYPEAERHFSRAVSSNRDNSAAAHDFGTFLCQIGKGLKAKKYFDMAVANPLFRRSELSYMRAGECLANIGSAEAEEYLKKALAINPRLAPALFRLARMKYDARNYMSSRAYIERLFAVTEPQPESLLLAYEIESTLNAPDVAADYRAKLLKGFPASEQARSIRRVDR